MQQSFLKAALAAGVLASSFACEAGESSDKPWARHCSLSGVIADKHKNSDGGRYMAEFAQRCEPIDACVLSCFRSRCAVGIAGSCFHACGNNQIYGYAELAELYASRDPRVCPSPPNNSFKPKPLRGPG